MLTEILSLGRTPTLVVSSAEAARAVLKTHDLDCCCRPRLSGSGRLTYNHMRKLFVLEPFILKRVQSFRFITGEVARIMNSIPQSSSPATPVYLTVMLYSLLASAVLRIDFGKRLNETKILISLLHVMFMTKRNEDILSNLPVMREFHNIFLGGVHAGAITVIWALEELAWNPRTMKKAQDEIRNSVGKKGRLAEQSIDELHPGRRGCPGILMGVTMVELALANLLYCLDWKSAKAIDINMEEAAGLTISKKMDRGEGGIIPLSAS
uniref:Cytochrome P450 family protein n=1 Tax=Populus trichocarpa TaxID=3694 RepID=A0A2K1YP48_POPTR